MLWIRRILLMGGVLFIALLVVVMVLENRQVTLAYWPVRHF